MLILAVDTSTRSGSFAVLRGDQLLGQQTTPAEQPYSVTFSPTVDALLSLLKLQLSDIDVFAVATGPGSFTGLRVGLTAVKAWSEVFGKPVVAVSVLEALAAQVLVSGDLPQAAFLAPVLDARRGQVFGGLYRRIGAAFGQLTPVSSDVVASGDEFLELIGQQVAGNEVIFPCPTPETIRPALERSALASSRIDCVSSVLAPTIGRLGFVKALRDDFTDALRLDANYVRQTDAEMRWKDGSSE